MHDSIHMEVLLPHGKTRKTMIDLILLGTTSLILFYFIFISIWKINKEIIHKPLEWLYDNKYAVATMILFIVAYIGLISFESYLNGE